MSETEFVSERSWKLYIDGRWRMWGYIVEVERYLRVVTLDDRETVDNAFFDRRFKP